MDLLRLLRGARWLTTSQVRRRFFRQVSLDAARRRLRILVEAGYLVKVQPDRTREALFTLGREGKRAMEKAGNGEIALERRLPRQLEHFLAVNDVRIAAELVDSLDYFFAYWELPGIGWKYPLIPDAVFSVGGRTFALEVDRAQEAIPFFVRTKISVYRNGLPGFPLAAVVVVTEGMGRMNSLSRATNKDGRGRFLFTTVDLVERHDITAPIFRLFPGNGEVALL